MVRDTERQTGEGGVPTRARILAVSLALVALSAACASGRFRKLDAPKFLPSDVPSAFENQFEVSDSGPAAEKGRKRHRHARHEKRNSKFKYASRRPAADPMRVGEKLTFEVSYLGMAAVDITTEVMPFQVINDRKVYHVHATAQTLKVFGLFYRANDTLDSYFDYEGLFSHRFHMLFDESHQWRDLLELNDSVHAKTLYWSRSTFPDARPANEIKQVADIPRFPQDLVSSWYYLRTLPLPDGKVIEFPYISEAKHHKVVVTVLRRETMTTPVGRLPAIVANLELIGPEGKKSNSEIYIWLSDDERKYVLRLEAHTKIGTLVATLVAVEPGVAPESNSNTAKSETAAGGA